MNCEDVRTHLHELVKLRLDPSLRGAVGAHLEGCASCTLAERTEHALDELLEQRLPRFPAPATLQRRLGLLLGRPQPAPSPRRWRRRSRSASEVSSCSVARTVAATPPA